MDRAHALGFPLVATGHYARRDQCPTTRRLRLLKGRDPRKDQSYFLFGLTQDQLAAALFPLGELSKPEVRALAAQMGLVTAAKPESQEICFVPDDDYAAFVVRNSPGCPPGPIVLTDGRVVGRHDGIHNFTVGQRRGLGITSSRPLYVTRIDASSNTVFVGEEVDLHARSFEAHHVNWASIEPPERPIRAQLRIRSRSQEAPATIEPLGLASVRVILDTAQRAVTPGQAAVFYDGDLCLGGGWIASIR